MTFEKSNLSFISSCWVTTISSVYSNGSLDTKVVRQSWFSQSVKISSPVTCAPTYVAHQHWLHLALKVDWLLVKSMHQRWFLPPFKKKINDELFLEVIKFFSQLTFVTEILVGWTLLKWVSMLLIRSLRDFSSIDALAVKLHERNAHVNLNVSFSASRIVFDVHL